MSKDGWFIFVGWTEKGADDAASAIDRGECPQNKPPENQVVTSALEDKPVRLSKSLGISLESLGFAICNISCIPIGCGISPWCPPAWELAGEVVAEPTMSITDADWDLGFPLCSDTGRAFAVKLQALFNRIQLLQRCSESLDDIVHLIFRCLQCSASERVRVFSQS